jgi:GTP:adenosylcobinamide-phosphate guanylyltransferase
MNHNSQTITAPLDAIVTAGGIPQPGEPLFEYCKGNPKALLNFGGKPMIQWVLDALSESSLVNRVVIIGLPLFTDLHCSHQTTILESQGSILGNLQAGVKELESQGNISQKVLAVSSDVPAIHGEMIDWFVNSIHQTEHDLYYNVITRQSMESKYPASNRTYIRLKEMEVCGGDINAFDHRMIFQKQKLFQEVIGSRKNPVKQAAILGFDTLFLLLIRQMTLHQAEENISKKIGSRCRAILCAYAEMGMDVDKPHQYDQLLSSMQLDRNLN